MQTASAHATARPLWLSRAARGLLWVLVAGLLAAVFALYAQSDFLLTLANQLWACF
jgi:hypothetical protein